jgi:hypothetical protein
MSTIRSEKRSSARNAFGRDWNKNASIRNLATDTSRAVDRLVDASAALIGVPWKTGGSGALALLPLGFTGNVPNDEKKTTAFVARAHELNRRLSARAVGCAHARHGGARSTGQDLAVA